MEHSEAELCPAPLPQFAQHSPADPTRNPSSSCISLAATAAATTGPPHECPVRAAKCQPGHPSPAPAPSSVNVSPSQRNSSSAALLFQRVSPLGGKVPKTGWAGSECRFAGGGQVPTGMHKPAAGCTVGHTVGPSAGCTAPQWDAWHGPMKGCVVPIGRALAWESCSRNWALGGMPKIQLLQLEICMH